RIACNSDATATSLTRWCPGTRKRIQVISNGIPLETFETAQPAEFPDLPLGVPRVVFVGRLETDKDHATLLRALALVPNVQTLLVGDGPLRGKLEALAQTLGIERRVTFLGKRNDVASVLKASDVFV